MRNVMTNKIGSKIQKFAAAMAMLIAGATMAHANTQVNPSSVSFGSEVIGTVSSPQTITITNDGRRSVTISRMATSSVNFAFHYAINLPVTLDPGQTFTATIVFKPSAVQAYS